MVEAILKEIHLEYSLEGLLLNLKLQYFGHLMEKANSLVKTLMLEKVKGKRRKGQQRMKWLDSIINSKDMSLDRGAWCAAVLGIAELDTT